MALEDTHRNCIKINKYTRVRSEFFSERVITVWNGLTEDITVFKSLARSKNSILATDFTAHLKCFRSYFIFCAYTCYFKCNFCGQLSVHLYALLSGHAAYD